MKNSIRGTLAATTGLCLVMTGGNAWAQAASAEQAGEIVVTAQKREERLLDVPAAISVVGGS
ncbi:MAG: hypothetical protein ACREB5_00010 [Sphingomonadaceae bacterium]